MWFTGLEVKHQLNNSASITFQPETSIAATEYSIPFPGYKNAAL